MFRGQKSRYYRKTAKHSKKYFSKSLKSSLMLPRRPLFLKLIQFGDRLAISKVLKTSDFDYRNRMDVSYRELLYCGSIVSDHLERNIMDQDGKKSNNDRVAILAPRDFHYPSYLLGTWISKFSVVPLYEKHPLEETKYYIENSDAKAVLCHPFYLSFLDPVCKIGRAHV